MAFGKECFRNHDILFREPVPGEDRQKLFQSTGTPVGLQICKESEAAKDLFWGVVFADLADAEGDAAFCHTLARLIQEHRNVDVIWFLIAK